MDDIKSKESPDESDKSTLPMPVAALFESNNSVTDILREEALKSVVSIELNSLGGFASQDKPLPESTTSMAAPRPSPATRTSSSASGEFLQKMLATLNAEAAKGPSATETSSAPTRASAGYAKGKSNPGAKSVGPPALTSKSVQEMTESKNWNNLGSHEDVNVADVFKTQQEVAKTGGTGTSATGRKKGKTDWGALMFQGLSAASVPQLPAPAPAPLHETVVSAPDVTVASNPLMGKKRGRSEVTAQAAPPTMPLPPTGNKVYYEPRDVDVLLGRGGKANNHPGNKRYLTLKDSMQDRYMAADKNEKTAISQELVDIVNKQWGGKFLKLDPLNDRYYEVDNVTARKKCSQTLREINTAEVRAAKRAKYQK